MAVDDRTGVHLVAGGFPPGSSAGHDIDFARAALLGLLSEPGNLRVTVANDFADLDRWLPTCRLLVSYVAGPYPAGAQLEALDAWLVAGGRWLALHGTSGGKAARDPDNPRIRRMVQLPHHRLLGGFFLNHPPICRFPVEVSAGHPITDGVPAAFDAVDELYLVEVLDPQARVLLRTELASDPSPPGFGFAYERDTSVGADGRTRVLGLCRRHGAGEVAYLALGHCHSPATNVQPFVDPAVSPGGATPLTFRGVWEQEPYLRLLRNAVRWGTSPAGSQHTSMAAP